MKKSLSPSSLPLRTHPLSMMLFKLGSIRLFKLVESFEVLAAGLKVVSKLPAEHGLVIVECEVAIDQSRCGYIQLLWLVLESGGNCCSSEGAWSGSWCW